MHQRLKSYKLTKIISLAVSKTLRRHQINLIFIIIKKIAHLYKKMSGRQEFILIKRHPTQSVHSAD